MMWPPPLPVRLPGSEDYTSLGQDEHPLLWLPAAIGLANQYYLRGQLADAVAVLRKAQQQHPQSVIVMNNLAQSLSDQGHHAEALARERSAQSVRRFSPLPSSPTRWNCSFMALSPSWAM